MLFAPEELKAMYSKVTTEDLEAQLTELRATISKLRSRGASWAMDCRQMRIAQHNEDLVFAELRRRREEDMESSKK
tara:strand:+ start:66 stop:293 length:228 start_codon:yes stop_codon:yes gene_type:complete